jgi:hypothetical protein
LNLSDAQTYIKTLLDTCTQLQYGEPAKPVPVLIEDTKDLATEIEKAVSGIGMLILIGNPIFLNRGAERVLSGDVEIEIAIAENPAINRADGNSNIRAMDAAQFVAQRLHGKSPGYPFGKIVITSVDFVPDEEKQLFEVKLKIDATMPGL